MHKINVLWAVPRSTSTAFEWMMRQRGDMTCFHEPFGEAWYQGENPLWPRVSANSVRTAGLSLTTVLKDLCKAAAEKTVFSKDFPHYITSLWTEDFLSMFSHSFLIRDPAKTIASMYKHWPDFHEDEVGFREQRQLFDKLTELNGRTPPVIDSDDVLAEPHTMIKQWCEATGIPFIERALSWKPGARDEVSWWDGGSFHENLRNSDGLAPQTIRHADISQTSVRAQDIYHRVMPHYEHLRQYRLQP